MMQCEEIGYCSCSRFKPATGVETIQRKLSQKNKPVYY